MYIRKSVQVFLIHLHSSHQCWVCVSVCLCVCVCECGKLFNVQQILEMFRFGTCRPRLFVWGTGGCIWLGRAAVSCPRLTAKRSGLSPPEATVSRLLGGRAGALSGGLWWPGCRPQGSPHRGHTVVTGLRRGLTPSPHSSWSLRHEDSLYPVMCPVQACDTPATRASHLLEIERGRRWSH